MYELTIKFETKEELQEYLGGVAAKTAVKTKATKKTKAKPKAEKPKEEVKEEVPVDSGPSLDEKLQTEKAEALDKLSVFINEKKAAHGFDAVVAMANTVKEQIGMNPNDSVQDARTPQINLFLQELAITVEDYELKKKKEKEAAPII